MLYLDFQSYLDMHTVQLIKHHLQGMHLPVYFVDNRVADDLDPATVLA